MTGAVLRLVRVSKSFQETVAVHNVSLDVARGELVCLLGPSGCGKTTTLRDRGLRRADGGEILIHGRGSRHCRPDERDIGMVFQSSRSSPT